jgi:segregation and condensation protein A
VVMAAWLLQLRSRLLLPADAPALRAAAAEADQLRERLIALQAMQALAGWLERQPQLGHDVFARGRPEVFGASADTETAPDVVAFLWASLALFDDTTDPEPATVYRPVHLDLYVVAEARDRIMRLLRETPGSVPFERLLPEAPKHTDSEARRELLRRSAWSSTFTASLELVKQGDVVVEQGGDFQPIRIMA